MAKDKEVSACLPPEAMF